MVPVRVAKRNIGSSVGDKQMRDHSEFVLDEPIPPVLVTRQLLQLIEQRIAAAESDFLGDEGRAADGRFQLAIDDAYGTETFSSTQSIPTLQLPETTSTIRLESTRYIGSEPPNDSQSLSVKFIFRAKKTGNRILVRAHGPQARERVMGLSERIEQLLEPQNIDSLVFRREPMITVAALLAIFGGFLWALVTVSNIFKDQGAFHRHSYWYWTVAILTSAAYVVISKAFFPNCAFETRRWSRIEGWKDWAVKGFAGALVFDVGFVMLLNHIATDLGITLH